MKFSPGDIVYFRYNSTAFSRYVLLVVTCKPTYFMYMMPDGSFHKGLEYNYVSILT